jgi:hypothetical protein
VIQSRRAYAIVTLNSFVIGCILLFSACQTEKTRPISSAVPPGLTLQEVEKAIAAGTARRDWVITQAQPGELVARIFVRRHMAEVGISYDASNYRIEYRDSENLDAHSGRVHQNYFRWVRNLDKAIQIELSTARTPTHLRPSAGSSPD